jgi:hypothetical protein
MNYSDQFSPVARQGQAVFLVFPRIKRHFEESPALFEEASKEALPLSQ